MKRKIGSAFAGFLAFMLLFTLLSRAADSMTVARVTAQRARKGRISHRVSGSGKVVQNREQAVSTLAGQTVKAIYVEEGQQVAAGDLLFEVDLESLRGQILEKKQEIQIADLQTGDKLSALDAQKKQDAINQSHAAQDYAAAAQKGGTAVSRAKEEWNRARKKLSSLKEDATETGADAVQAVLEETCREKQADYDLALQNKEDLEEAIDDLVEKALTDAQEDASAMRANVRATVGAQEVFTEETPFPDEAAQDTTADPTLLSAAAHTETENVSAEPENTAGTAQQREALPDGQESYTTPQTETPYTGIPQDEGEWIVGESGDQSWEKEDPWLLELRIRQENQPLLDAADQQIRLLKGEKEEADAALADYLQKKAQSAQMSVSEMRRQLTEEVRAKRQAYEDAVMAANDGLRSAAQAAENASAPKGSDSTAEIDAITREQKELELSKLERLLAADGKVTSPIDGVVLSVQILTGEKTPDGTAILLSDKASGNKLVVRVSQEQDAYIARSDPVTVTTGSGKKLEGLTVDSVRTDEEDAEQLDVTVQLPADAIEAGVSATMEAVRDSELFDCCIPVQALYEDKGGYYVFVLTEKETVLGTELSAQRIDVQVLDKNETDAALQNGSLNGGQQVIVASDKTLAQGSRVRLEQ